MKYILVTGGLGFLGFHLVERLVKGRNKVIIVDNVSSNIVAKDFFNKQCEVIVQDIADYKPKRKFDQIYHLASIVGPAGVLPHAGTIGYKIMLEINNVLNIALKTRAKLLLVSTSEVYGQKGVLSENMPKMIRPDATVRLSYGVGKLLAEIESLNKAQVSSLSVNIVRPFNIVGPRQSSRGGFVLPRFIELALKDEDITVFGNGEQVRSFTDVRDVVEGMIIVMKSGVKGEIFNLGNKENITTINNLATLVKKLTKSSSRIIHVDPKTIYGPLFEEALDKIPNPNKMKNFFGWEAKIPLVQTILETIAFYEQKIQKIK